MIWSVTYILTGRTLTREVVGKDELDAWLAVFLDPSLYTKPSLVEVVRVW